MAGPRSEGRSRTWPQCTAAPRSVHGYSISDLRSSDHSIKVASKESHEPGPRSSPRLESRSTRDAGALRGDDVGAVVAEDSPVAAVQRRTRRVGDPARRLGPDLGQDLVDLEPVAMPADPVGRRLSLYSGKWYGSCGDRPAPETPLMGSMMIPRRSTRIWCGSPDVRSRGRVERRFRSLPIGSRATFVDLPIPRVECRACGVVRQ